MNRRSLLSFFATIILFGPAFGQDDVPERLRSVLRTAKQDPGAALDEVRQTPDAAVDDVLRQFQQKASGVKIEDLKAAAQKAQADGTVERVLKQANEVMQKEAPELAKEVEKQTAAAPAIIATPTAPTPLATPTTETAPMTETDVPATRPAPGVVGGAPAPVAMPVEVPEELPAVARRAVEATPAAIGSEAGTVMTEGTAEPIAGAAPTTPMIPDSPLLKGDDIPAPKPLAKKYQKDAQGAYPVAGRKHMEILSKESVMDNTKGVLLFTGDVFIDHPEFEIKCDKLEIQTAEGVGMDSGGKSDANFKRAIASGGMVEIRRMVEDKGKKKTQIAIARNADYNAITKDIILSGGPPYIQDGENFVKTNSEDAKIIMRGNGLYEITGTTNRSTISIKIDEDKQKGAKKKDPLGGGLEGTFDRFR